MTLARERPQAVTISAAYEPVFNWPTSFTDPLGHVWVTSDAGGGDVFIEVLFEIVMAGNFLRRSAYRCAISSGCSFTRALSRYIRPALRRPRPRQTGIANYILEPYFMRGVSNHVKLPP
jgi:hypothetical protein